MHYSMDTNESIVVSVASIAAELHSVSQVAWGVSLAAKNAKVMSVQAGEKAQGFQPITKFIDEISQQAIDGVREINHEALRLSRLTVAEHRARDAYVRFSKVMVNHENVRYLDSLRFGMSRVTQELESTRGQFTRCINHLALLLESMNECMLSAHAIASVSRIVTSNIDDYGDKLMAVADNLDEAATYIKRKLAESNAHLGRVSALVRQQREEGDIESNHAV